MNHEWPNLLADLKAKRDALNQVITTIETHFVPVNGEMPASSVNGRTVRRTNRGKVVKASKTAEDYGEAVLGALRKNNPMMPGQLADRLAVDRATLRHWLSVLVKAKRVEITGNTTNRQVWLPGTARRDL